KIVHADDPTIFVRTWNDALPAVPGADALVTKWTRILAVRATVQKELEAVRQAGAIGSSLQAEVDIIAGFDDYTALASLADDLRFVLITSAAGVRRGDALSITVASSGHPKCDRCWHWRADVGSDARHPGLCGRCLSNLYGAGEARRYA
ncbi:MAG TPA: zinc finger domain-containing protein, partial [Casimicrobiaceae bacterium]|nr:zinc finger domain-containing protein [Casimicrobiaceae bacterium]